MNIAGLIIVATLAFHSTAYASVAYDGHLQIATYSGQALHPDQDQASPRTNGQIVGNAAACAPDSAEPVWDGNSALLGYSCVTASANGA